MVNQKELNRGKDNMFAGVSKKEYTGEDAGNIFLPSIIASVLSSNIIAAMDLKRLAYKFLSLINYYFLPVNLNRHKKIVFQEPYYVPFSPTEVNFLKLSAASFNYNPDYSQGYLQKPLFTVELSQVVFLGNTGAMVIENKLLAESVFNQLRMSISPAYRKPDLMWNRQKKVCIPL